MPKNLEAWLKLPKKLEVWLKLTGRILYVLLVFSVLIFIWLKSFHLAATGYAALPNIKGPWDLSAILFASAQVCLFVVSILIAILTIVGWQAIEHKIQESVEKKTTERLAKLENEIRGRSFAILGYTIGETNVEPDFSGAVNEARLQEAIQYCDQAYTFLRGTELPAEFMALNNFLIYSCALSKRYKSRRGYILGCAHRLKNGAEEHGSQNLLLTYCHTILEFSLEPREWEEAISILKVISDKGDINEKQQREVKFLTSLCIDRKLLIDPMS